MQGEGCIPKLPQRQHLPKMTKILVVKTTSMGDIVHTLPAITDLKNNFKNSISITWLCEEPFWEIPSFHPAVNKIILTKVRTWRKKALSSETWAEIKELNSIIKRENFEIAIDCQGLIKSGILTYLTGKKTVKCGFDKNSIREKLATKFYDKTYSVPSNLSLIETNRALFAKAFGYEINSAADFSIKNSKINKAKPLEIKAKYWMGFIPSSKINKMWDGQNWLELSRKLFEEYGLIGYLTYYSKDEEFLVRRIADESERSLEVLPKLSISEIALLIKDSEFCVGVDTGLTHLSNALNHPTLIIHNFHENKFAPSLVGDRAKNLFESPNPDQVMSSIKELVQIQSKEADKLVERLDGRKV